MAPQEIKTLDQLLLVNGHQIKNYIIIGIGCFLVTSFALSYIITTSHIKHRCTIPECEDPRNSSYLTPWIKHAVPYDKDGNPETCSRYQFKGSGSCSDSSSFDKTKLVKCNNSYVFEGKETNLLTEFNLECDNKWKLALIGSLDGIGALIGTPICAFVSDKFGRKRALCLFSICCVILGFIRSLSVNLVMYAVLDFFNEFLDFGIFGTSFVLCMELVSSRHRIMANVIFNLFGSLGYIYLGLVGIWFPDWRWMLRALYANGLIFFFYFWLAPESARWLLVKNRDAEAIETVKNTIKNNPKTKHVNVEELLSTTKRLQLEEVRVGYLKTLKLALTSCTLLTRLIHSSVCWLGVVFLWYGSLQQSVSLSGDKHANVVFSALAQVPGYILSGLSFKLGHKITLLASLMLCSIGSFIYYFMPDDPEYNTVRLILYLCSMMGVTSSYAVLYTSTIAMFPTPLRQSLLAFCSMVGRFGHILAPQVVLQLGEYTLLIFGFVAFAVACLAMFQPETLHLDLPDTINEAEKVGSEPVKNNENS
uniref:Organic cation transporter 1 n=1 Tax=Cacopsylla melanoneura TaxID=428564 RepID=A0A8D9AGS9_9HEMI